MAIDCFCLPSEGDLKVAIPASNTLTYTDFEDGKYYLFAPFGNIQYNLIDNNGKKFVIKINGLKVACKVVYRTGTTLKIRSVIYQGFINVYNKLVLYHNPDIYDWYTITSLTIDDILGGLYYKSNSIPNPTIAQIYEPNGGFNSIISTTESLANLNDVNRADPKLVKIITIPYFPSVYEYDPATYVIKVDSTWVYENSTYNSFQLNMLNTHFSSTIESEVHNPLEIFDLGSLNIDLTANRDDYFESKLFHSEFYQPKFVYDSFGFIFELEKVDEGFNQPYYFSFDFVMTSTINSKFMFKFKDYRLKMSTQDYDNILPVARNNEAPIYNSGYITYLMSAYRYDLKYLGLKEARTTFGAEMGTFDAMGSAIGQKSTAGALVSGGLGITKTLFNAITDLYYNEYNMQAKIDSLKNQSVSVSGSDDLDLMENYAGNKAKLCLYTPSSRMKKLIADLFYYFGYSTNEIKIPLTHTRYWFNYLECELELTGVSDNITEVLKEDLINRYRNGITFLHNNSSAWDFEQVKENWELNLIGG